MSDQTLLTALGALADEWEADSAEAREGGPVRMVVGRCCADLRALIAAHQSAEPERCGWCQQAMNSKPAFDCRNPSHSPAHQCVELSEGNSTEPIDFREEIDASERTDTAEADHVCERGDRLEAMCERLADRHVALQDAVTWALSESLAWRDKMPRTRENQTYPNGRQDGVDAVVATVRAAVCAHLRGEDPAQPSEPDRGER